MTHYRPAIDKLKELYQQRNDMDIKDAKIQRLEMQIAQLVVKLKEKDDRIEQLTQALSRKVTARDGNFQSIPKGRF